MTVALLCINNFEGFDPNVTHNICFVPRVITLSLFKTFCFWINIALVVKFSIMNFSLAFLQSQGPSLKKALSIRKRIFATESQG